jgi:tetratricopeptide (TPR) repeat protein
MVKKIIILSFILGLGVLPSLAQIDGKVSKNNFYETDKSIMSEVTLNKTIKTEKYWEKNLFYFNKYRPLFMLSNKELYDLMPKENESVVQRINAPSIYNISLKTASIKTTSLSSPVIKKQPEKNKIAAFDLTWLYEQAKNPDVDSDNKIDAAIELKNSKNLSNYLLALDLLNDVTKKEPYNAYAYYIKGEIYSAKKDSENAMKNYVQALKINPTSKQSCLGIAKILELTNKELAKKYYNRAMLLSEK